MNNTIVSTNIYKMYVFHLSFMSRGECEVLFGSLVNSIY